MDQISLAGSGRITTRLGFGCSSLMGGISRRESLALLDAAYDAGIRHFDVAPLYGWGEAEDCVGKFLRSRPGQTTVTTKYGILPPPRRSWSGMARQIARPVIRAFPGLKDRLARAAKTAVGESSKPPVSASEARASLDRSLAALGTDRVDLWLLHDIDADRLSDPELLDVMQEAVASGRIGDYGASNDVSRVPALYQRKREFCRVLQFEWSVCQPLPGYPGAFRIHYRSLAHNFAALRDYLAQNSDILRAWSDELGCELASAGVLSALMLKAAVSLNPGTVILISSRDKAHIAADVLAVEDSRLERPARRFYELVQREFSLPANS